MGYLKSESSNFVTAVFTAAKMVIGKGQYIFSDYAIGVLTEIFGDMNTVFSDTVIDISESMRKAFTGKYCDAFLGSGNPYVSPGYSVKFAETGLAYPGDSFRVTQKNAVFSVLFYSCGKYSDIFKMESRKDSEGKTVSLIPLPIIDTVFSEMLDEKTVLLFDEKRNAVSLKGYTGERKNLYFVGVGYAFPEILKKRITEVKEVKK